MTRLEDDLKKDLKGTILAKMIEELESSLIPSPAIVKSPSLNQTSAPSLSEKKEPAAFKGVIKSAQTLMIGLWKKFHPRTPLPGNLEGYIKKSAPRG